MSSSLPKIIETGINVFLSNSQIITIKTYYEKLTIIESSRWSERIESSKRPGRNWID